MPLTGKHELTLPQQWYSRNVDGGGQEGKKTAKIDRALF